jgi:hypothetical protein
VGGDAALLQWGLARFYGTLLSPHTPKISEARWRKVTTTATSRQSPVRTTGAESRLQVLSQPYSPSALAQRSISRASCVNL